ncbi:ABC transporter substrate-binding protein [Parafrankia colletiae]|uniref:ABC transporter substrate-binding protein n=1 Tax=Parafrankia colletiae TaxID=573497 RepID=A0A1S1RDD7_9ACTN|nr:glutamate ABC transporter substrate-binding protein [Parafrankia colletiae]MCK9898546.1 glutamate ABC transporter substrate-binding protein [Frankia sp. Cpl3]OHV44097.1 ABC transporter substrate-binding protein [Parafrankia colletiae]
MRMPFTRTRQRTAPTAPAPALAPTVASRRSPRRAAFVLTAAMVASLALAACGDDDSDDEAPAAAAATTFPAGSTMAELQSAGSITVGTKFDQPLFGLKNLRGEPEGFDVEIAKIITNALGIPEDKVKFVETVSANREPFIQQGRVDLVVATYTINDKRKQVIDFAGPYYVAGQTLMVGADETAITGKDTLAGKKVCSVSGSTPAERIRTEAPQAELVLFDVYSKCAEALKNGQVDAVTTDNAILLGLMDSDPDTFKLVGEPFSTEPYGIGIAKGDDDFRTFINETLTAAYSDGRYEDAYESTIGKVEPDMPTPPAVDNYTS